MDSTDRILDAAIERFALGGLRAVSIREVARVAGVDPSAIQYRFGSKANLWNVALDRAMKRDALRLRQLGEAMDTLNGGRSLAVDDYVTLVRLYVSDSVATHRETTILWHTGLIDGLRQGAPWPQITAWYASRQTAWDAIAERMGLSAGQCGAALLVATSTIEIFLLGMEDGIERSLYCDAFVRLIGLRLFGLDPAATNGGWFATWCATRTDARFEPSKPDGNGNGPPHALGEAVARLLLIGGAEGITHRAIAAEANLSLAATTRHFATLQDLLRAGYDHIGVNMLRNVEAPGVAQAFTDAMTMAQAVARVWLSDNAMHGRALAGLLDVNIAAARDPALLPMASAIIAKLTLLAVEYFADENALGVHTPFEAHAHYALSQMVILLSTLEGGEAEALVERSAAKIVEISTMLFPHTNISKG